MDKNKALLIYAGWMGDFMWLVPTIRALGKKFSSLSLVVSEQQKDLAESLVNGGIEQVVEKVFVDFKYDQYGKFGQWTRRLKNWSSIRKAAKKADIGTYIDLVGKWKTGMCIPFGSKTDAYIPAKADCRKEHWMAKTIHRSGKDMPPRDQKRHMVDSYLSVLPFFGIEDYKVDFRLNYDLQTIDYASRIIKENGLRNGGCVVLNLGSAQYSKIWPTQNFLNLALKLKKEGVKVVIMGAYDFRWNKQHDRRVSETYFADYNGLVMINPDTPPLVNAFLLSSGAFDVSVGCDSYAGHIAGPANEVDKNTPGAVMVENGKYKGRYFKANTRCVDLMGPTSSFYRIWDPTEFNDRGGFHEIIRPKDYYRFKEECLGSWCRYDGTDRVCRNYGRIPEVGSPCMNSITVEEVFNAIIRQLRKS